MSGPGGRAFRERAAFGHDPAPRGSLCVAFDQPDDEGEAYEGYAPDDN
ncbi:hypothetical protein WEH80_11030 [Actinomycetes bacterium KLBMP 9759]